MKTNIKSLIIICTLGLVGVLNASAALSYNTSGVVRILEEQNLRLEHLNSADFVFNADAIAEFDYQKEAQMVTKWVADREEAKAIQMVYGNLILESNGETASLFVEESENLNFSELVFNENAEIDYQKEAQLITKRVADNEEAKFFKKYMDEVN